MKIVIKEEFGKKEKTFSNLNSYVENSVNYYDGGAMEEKIEKMLNLVDDLCEMFIAKGIFNKEEIINLLSKINCDEIVEIKNEKFV